MAVVAVALGLALSGPRRLDAALVAGAWIGDGRARASAIDISRALWLYLFAGFLGLASLVLMALATEVCKA